MKKMSARFRDYTIGATVTTMLLVGTTAFGEPAIKSLDAVFNNIEVVIDGMTIQPKDSDGKTVEPFIVEGTTYLPLRAIATALGKLVEWDQKTNTVIIGNSPSIAGEIISLLDLKPYANGLSFHDKLTPFQVYQETYQPAINDIFPDLYSYQSSWGKRTMGTYLLKGNYKNLNGKFAVDDSIVNSKASLTITGDGKEIYKTTVSKGDKPQIIDLNLIGINELKIDLDGGASSENAHFWDVTLAKISKQ